MRCGHVTHITACPVGYSEMPDMTSEDIDKLASKALKRRTNLSWESFNEFYDDIHSICFIETIEVNGEISFLTISRLIFVSFVTGTVLTN